MWEVLSKPLEYNLNVNSGMLKKLSHFHELISDLIAQNEKLNAFELAQQVIKKTGIATETYRDMTPEGMSRAENIQELLNAMNIFVTQRQEEGNDNISLSDFLSEVSLLTDQDTDSDSNSERVTLMTVHSAKGLEFDHVFVVGMEEDLFPVVMAKNEMQGLEEERRLFYVAITRAKKTCTLTYAKSRFKNGRVISTRESRFLIDIDRKFLLTHGDTFSDVCSEHGDGFWSSLRHQKDEMTNARNQKPVYSSQQEKFSPVTQTSFQPLSKEAEGLCEGDIIEHERFGRGVVSEIESSGNDKRAFVDFDSAGRKQLLLKFAKFKIVK